VKRRGMSERLFRRSRQPTLPIGDAGLDREYEVHSAHPELAQQLFIESVIRPLKQLSDHWPSIVINDDAVQVHLSSPPATTSAAMSLVNQLVELAQAIDSQRSQLSVPAPLEPWIAPWKQIANERGLDFEINIPAISGSVDRRRVLIVPRGSPDGEHKSEVQLFFRPHRRTGLRIQPQTEDSTVGQDIVVGSETFDRKFLVKGYDPTYVREILNEKVQQLLLSLADRGSVELDDRRLLLREASMSPEDLLSLLDEVESIANAMRW